MEKWLIATNKVYHMLEMACNNHKDINSWKVKCIFFEAYYVILLYGKEMWGESILNKMLEDTQNLCKSFTCRCESYHILLHVAHGIQLLAHQVLWFDPNLEVRTKDKNNAQ